jgi:large subunit ribosomal protein L32
MPSFSACPQCGDPHIQHRVCPNCGYYRKEQRIEADEF